MDRKKEPGKQYLYLKKTDFKTKDIKRDSKGHFIILKGRLHQGYINIVHICAPNIDTPNYIKKILRTSRKILTATQL